MPADCSSLPESEEKVGAQSPSKIPNRSACACASGPTPLAKNQMAIDPMMEANPSKKQGVESGLSCEIFLYSPTGEKC